MKRGKRLAAQLVLIAFIIGLSLLDEDVFVLVVSLILIPLFIISVSVAGILIWTSRQAPEIETLRERADDAVTGALASGLSAVAALVALGREPIERLYGIVIPGRPVLGAIACVLILVAVPSLGWLGTWRNVWLPKVQRKRAGAPEPDEPPYSGVDRRLPPTT